MLLLIDYGESTARTLLIFDDEKPPLLLDVPLGFSAYTEMTVTESVRFIIKAVAEKSAVEILVENKPKIPIYIMGEVASTSLKELLAGDPFDPSVILKEYNMPLVSVGMDFCFVLGKVLRGEKVGENILEWLPFKVDPSIVDNFMANKKLFQQVLPTTPRDLSIEQAAARIILKEAVSARTDLPEEIIFSGAVFSKAPRASQVMLMALDGLEPIGPLAVLVDKEQMVNRLALLQKVSPEIYGRLLPQLPAMTNLGTVLGLPGGGELIFDSGLGEPQEILAAEGTLTYLPLPAGETAIVTLKRDRAKNYKVKGGEVGVIIDCRRRPISLPVSPRDRISLLKQWDKAVNAHGQAETI